MVLLAAFKALLHRYTGQDDLLVGSGVANRPLREIERLIGMIVNMVVLRTDVSGNPSFRELLGRVRQTTLGAYARQEYPFERLVAALHPARVLNHNPLFQAAFSFHDSPVPELTFAGITGTVDYLQNSSAKFDLNIVAVPRAEQLAGRHRAGADAHTLLIWEYDTDLFEAATIEGLAAHYHSLLESIVADPDLPVSSLRLMTDAERRLLLVERNATQREYPRQSCIHELFEEQASRAPEAVAVLFEDVRLTYGGLNRRANRLAHRLRKMGIGREVRVGVCMERSPELIVALLGILKAGGAYLPLDPGYPKKRLRFMLENGQVSVLLTQERLRSVLPRHDGRTFCIDSEWASLAGESGENPDAQAGAENLAYVMYTSGSTGEPKGVCVLHRGVVRLVRNVDYANLDAREVLLHLAPVSFDASTFEIWGALLNGARLAVLSPGRFSLKELAAAVKRYGVTTLWLTAPLFHEVVEQDVETLRGVRQILAGGDVLSPAHVKSVLETLAPDAVVNGYGPTESTTFACCHRMTDPADVEVPLPIGRPIANTRVYILDRYRRPVPSGVPGELWIGGDGLARGYLNADELTAERFVQDPAGVEPGGRLYRTGDLARYRRDGSIAFLGRLDAQLKIRGFRVEPGEIESVLAGHPSIRQAAVSVRDDPPGGKRLIAYVVRKDGTPPAAWRSFLTDRLPDYMVPGDFVILDEMPLTPGGKIDRRALPAPVAARSGDQTTFVGPGDELERRLVEVWEQTLDTRPIGIRDNFFDRGGHSLLAVRLVAEIEKALGDSLPLEALFRFSTVEQMASVIRERRRASVPKAESGKGVIGSCALSAGDRKRLLAVMASGTNQPLRPGSLVSGVHLDGSRPPLFWCFNQPGYESPALAGQLGPDQPLFCLFSGSEVLKWNEKTPCALARHYVEEIRAVDPHGPYSIGGNCQGARVACEIALLLRERGQTVRKLCLMEFFDPRLFDYEDPLLLLYGETSRLREQRRFGWPQEGWSRPFRVVPEVSWLPCGHGQYFREPFVRTLASKLSSFLAS